MKDNTRTITAAVSCYNEMIVYKKCAYLHDDKLSCNQSRRRAPFVVCHKFIRRSLLLAHVIRNSPPCLRVCLTVASLAHEEQKGYWEKATGDNGGG